MINFSFTLFFQAPSIHHIVGAFIIFLPFEVEVYLYLGFSLTQSVVAVPYLVWG